MKREDQLGLAKQAEAKEVRRLRRELRKVQK